MAQIARLAIIVSIVAILGCTNVAEVPQTNKASQSAAAEVIAESPQVDSHDTLRPGKPELEPDTTGSEPFRTP